MSSRPGPPMFTPLPAHDIKLLDATGPLGWIAGNRLGFTGFADVAEASAAAWIAHVALERRRAKRELGPAPRAERPALYLTRSGKEEWIESPGRRLARLVRPEEPESRTSDGEATDTSVSWYGVEIVFPENASALTMGSSANVIYLGLRRSGLRWSIRAQNSTTPMTAFRLEEAPHEVSVADSQGTISRNAHLQAHNDAPPIDGRGIPNYHDTVDDAAFDSFPASDPPAWGGFRVGPPSLGRPQLAVPGVRQQERRILVRQPLVPPQSQLTGII